MSDCDVERIPVTKLGEYLRKIRKENKKTLTKLAEETGLSHSYLSQVENGKKTNPSMETLKKIAEAYNHPYLELYEMAGYINQFGECLEALRGKMSLHEASKRVGVSHTYIRDLELGKKTNPSKKTLKKIAEAYNHPYLELYEMSGCTPTDTNQFGIFLKELRGNRSLREIERLSGVSHVQLSNLEKGVDPRTGKKSEPSIETVIKLSKAYDIPLDDLVIGKHDVSKKALKTLEDIMFSQDDYGIDKYKKPLHHSYEYNWLKMALEELADMTKYIQNEIDRKVMVIEILEYAMQFDNPRNEIEMALKLLKTDGTGK